jgi:hypothetical protein
MVLMCAPDASHPVFAALAATYGLRLEVQQGADLGARMGHAVRTTLAPKAAAPGGAAVDRVILIGCDCPDLDAAYLTKAVRTLDRADAVLGPAADGGYVLLGLRQFDAGLFRDMPWGGAEVAELTRARLRALGRRWQELPVLRDLDRPEDLDLLT